MNDIKLNKNLVSQKILDYSEEISGKSKDILNKILSKNIDYSDWLGWVDYHKEQMNHDISDILEFQNKISVFYDCVVVVGIGGSYLGVRAISEACASINSSSNVKAIYYAGHHLCTQSHLELIKKLENKQPLVVVISKSGTTTEPGIAFRILRSFLEKKYGQLSNDRIIAVTDESNGALVEEAVKNKWQRFVIPKDIGGRYSVFTPVGLVPLSLAGYDLSEILKGVSDFYSEVEGGSYEEVISYASIRYAALMQGKKVEVLCSNTPKLNFLSEWWKQLFGESEGKEGKGLFPASITTTTDLHSMGQYMQQGSRQMIETFITFDKCSTEALKVPVIKDALDQLDYLVSSEMEFVNSIATKATIKAHSEGGLDCLELKCKDRSLYSISKLLCFFKLSCALSAYLIGVNPFNQPGVEDYKSNMFSMLNKPGH